MGPSFPLAAPYQQAAGRAAYQGTQVQTASPQKVLLLLLGRLVLDINGASAALTSGDKDKTHQLLTHAQDIVSALQAMLKPEEFAAGQALLSLYEYLYDLLVSANVEKDQNKINEALGLAQQLEDTWTQAAQASGQL